MKRETAEKAAKWWADHLRNGARLDNGDNSETGAMTLMMALLCQQGERANQNTEQIDSFEAHLADVLMTEGLDSNWVDTYVDYHPDHILSEAAQRAELDLGMTTLPWKTGMGIRDDVITVRCGYGAEAVQL